MRSKKVSLNKYFNGGQTGKYSANKQINVCQALFELWVRNSLEMISERAYGADAANMKS